MHSMEFYPEEQLGLLVDHDELRRARAMFSTEADLRSYADITRDMVGYEERVDHLALISSERHKPFISTSEGIAREDAFKMGFYTGVLAANYLLIPKPVPEFWGDQLHFYMSHGRQDILNILEELDETGLHEAADQELGGIFTRVKNMLFPPHSQFDAQRNFSDGLNLAFFSHCEFKDSIVALTIERLNQPVPEIIPSTSTSRLRAIFSKPSHPEQSRYRNN